MVIIDVLSANGAQPDPPIRVRFDAPGGTIGRAPTNHLRLPDPQRTVSRVHAQLVQRKGVTKIISRSANPMLIDDQPLEIGDEVALNDGSRIVMGGYTLRATLAR